VNLCKRLLSFGFAAACLLAQSNNPPQIKCAASAGVPPILRPEGVTELVGDILLTCTGGQPLAIGSQIPTANVSVAFNTAVTSRLLDQSGRSEALLLIDEPMSSTNPNVPINLCTTPAGCPVISNGTALNNFNGTAGHPNAFTGVVIPNGVHFDGIPIEPPASTSNRVFRITDVRANAASASGAGASRVIATPTFDTSGTTLGPIQINTPDNSGSLTTGFIATQSFSFGYNPTTVPATPGVPVNFTVYVGGQPINATVWKPLSPASNLANPLSVQPSTSILANNGTTESGLIIPDPITGTMMGAATQPTILDLHINIPQGVTASVPTSFGGYLIWTAFGGVVSGSNLSVTAGATGGIDFFGSIVQVQTSVPSINLPVTISGAFPTLPYTITGGIYFPPGPSFTEPITFSSAPASFPTFNQTFPDGSIFPNLHTLATLYQTGASPQTSIVNPNAIPPYTATSPLQATLLGQLGPAPQTRVRTSDVSGVAPRGTALALPAAYELGIVSSGSAISNLTMTKDPSATWLTAALEETTTPASVSLSFDPTAAPQNYTTTLNFAAPGMSALALKVNYTPSTAPWFTEWGFGNAGSYVNDVVAPGEEFVIFGYNFGPAAITTTNFDSGSAQTQLAGVQVMFDNIAAPLYYVVNTPANAVITGFAPFEIAGKTTTQVTVVQSGIASPPVTLNVVNAFPAIYTADSSGFGQGAIRNPDQSLNSASNPASPNDVVAAYGNGGGQTNPAGRSGAITGVGAPVPVFTLPVKVWVDGVLITDVPYAGPAPDEIEGVFQMNFRIPANARKGNLPVMIQIGDKITQAGVTVAVN